MIDEMRFLFVYLSFIPVIIHGQNEGTFENSGRLIRDIMEMFGSSSSTSDQKAADSGSSSLISSLIPPFGINRQLPSESAASRLTSSSTSLVSSVTNLFKTTANKQQHELEPNPLMPAASTDKGVNAAQWSSIAKDVIGLFAASQPTTTTTTQSPPLLGMQMLNPRFYQQLMPDWMQTLNPYRNNDELRRSPPSSAPSPPSSLFNAKQLFGPWTGVLDSNQPATQIDTGGNTFDRLVVRENADPEDPLGSIMGGKFNERGIQWSDGNLKLVNKKGNKLLGSEVAVRDRSIDIPVQRWFDIANNLVSAYSSSDNSIFSPASS